MMSHLQKYTPGRIWFISFILKKQIIILCNVYCLCILFMCMFFLLINVNKTRFQKTC